MKRRKNSIHSAVIVSLVVPFGQQLDCLVEDEDTVVNFPG